MTGYLGGVKALNQLLGHGRGSIDVGGDEGVGGWVSQQAKKMLQIKQLLAISHLRPDNERDRAQLLRFLSQGERGKSDAADAPANGIERAIYAMLQEFPWAFGPENIPEPLKEWQDKPAELSAEEEMLVAAGEKPPHLEEVKNLQFPLSRDVSPNTPQTNKEQ
jgi:hypothetical protein